MRDAQINLLAAMARAVIKLLNHNELEQTAKYLKEDLARFWDEQIEDDFAPATEALKPLERVSLEHTGGGIYVLYHYLTDALNDGPFVGITPSEQFEGKWLVCGYEEYQDEGTTFMVDGASTYDLLDRVTEIGGQVQSAIATKSVTYQIPGSFTVTVPPNDGPLKFSFSAAAGGAGYFGPALINDETGEQLTLDEAESIFAWIGSNFQFLGSNFQFPPTRLGSYGFPGDGRAYVTVEWEG